jgi:hypothetical protein
MLKGLRASVVVDFTAGAVSKQVQQQFPKGIEGLLDLVSDAAGFAGAWASFAEEAWPLPPTM